MAQAICDAAIIYGARRYFDGVHSEGAHPIFLRSYRREDDEQLFFELLHNLILYDQIILDNSSAASAVSEELLSFIAHVNSLIGRSSIQLVTIGPGGGSQAYRLVRYVPHRLAALLAELVRSSPDRYKMILEIPVPWAYRSDHVDKGIFRKSFDEIGLDQELIPFMIFAWRAIVYSSFARQSQRASAKRVTYVAAPGRMRALRALLGARDIAGYDFPREAWHDLVAELPSLPENGMRFDVLQSLSAIERSPLSELFFEKSPEQALHLACRISKSKDTKKLRKDWEDILFSTRDTFAVGPASIQIVRDVTVYGDINQQQHIQAFT